MHLYKYEYEADHYHGKCHIVLKKFIVLKETPRGYWILPEHFEYMLNSDTYYKESIDTNKRWVAKEGYKKFAHVDLKGAKESFIARKTKYIRILRNRLAAAEAGLQAIEKDDMVAAIVNPNMYIVPPKKESFELFSLTQ